MIKDFIPVLGNLNSPSTSGVLKDFHMKNTSNLYCAETHIR